MGQQGDLWVAPMEQREDGSWNVDMDVVFNVSNQGEIMLITHYDNALMEHLSMFAWEIEAYNIFYTYNEKVLNVSSQEYLHNRIHHMLQMIRVLSVVNK